MLQRLWQMIRGKRQPDEKGGPVDDYLTATGMLSSRQLEEAELLRHLVEMSPSALDETRATVDRGRGLMAVLFRGRRQDADTALQGLAEYLDANIDLTNGKKMVVRGEEEVNVNIEKIKQRLPEVLSRHKDFLVDYGGRRMDTYQVAMESGLVDANSQKSKEKMEALFTARAFQQMENLDDALSQNSGMFGFLKRMPSTSLIDLIDEANIEAERAIYASQDGLSEKYLGAYILMLEYIQQHQDDHGRLESDERELVHKLIQALQQVGYAEVKDVFDVNYLVSAPGKWKEEVLTADEALDKRLSKLTENLIQSRAEASYREEPFVSALDEMARKPDITALIEIDGAVTYEKIADKLRATVLQDATLQKELEVMREMASLLKVDVDVNQAMQKAAIEVVKEHPLLNEDLMLEITQKLEQARNAAVRRSPVGGANLLQVADDSIQQVMDSTINLTGPTKE
jgi:uncharacterized protein YlzI (FlbEa/FlbD family)